MTINVGSVLLVLLLPACAGDGVTSLVGFGDVGLTEGDEMVAAGGDQRVATGDMGAPTGDAAQPGDTDLLPDCAPACPANTVCADLDGVGLPECMWPSSGDLACDAVEHCPADGACDLTVNRCQRSCMCSSNPDCGSPELVCVTEDVGCGLCLPREYFSCDSDTDCVLVVDLSRCCSCPKPRNAETVAAFPCLQPYPFVGVVPAGCEPDCSGVEHCWPCDGSSLGCLGVQGTCRY